jgi:MSHA biogenesis protein MshO
LKVSGATFDMKKMRSNTGQQGFTLIEAIMVIVITGILGTMVAVFIRAPVDGYIDSVARAELTDAGDTALRRIGRDVRVALPNSLRTTSGGSTACFELLPTVGGGRYRIAQSSVPSGDILDFSVADSSFDVLGSSNLPPSGGFATPHHAVIYNLGIPGADAYTAADLNRAAIAAASTAANITLTAANKFPLQSPGNRFHVISDFSVIYSCSAGTLIRSTRAITAAQLAACPAVGTVLVGNVDCANSSFSYVPAVSQRNGLLTMTLVLTQPGSAGTQETISLYQEVHVDNTP